MQELSWEEIKKSFKKLDKANKETSDELIKAKKSYYKLGSYIKKAFGYDYNEENKELLEKINKLDKKAKILNTVIKEFEKTLNATTRLKAFLLNNLKSLDKEIKYLNNEKLKLDISKRDSMIETVNQKIEINFQKCEYNRIKMKLIKNCCKAIDKLGIPGSDLHAEINMENVNDFIKKVDEAIKKTEDYNLAKLRRAKKKIEESTKLMDFNYGRRNAKFTSVISSPIVHDKIDEYHQTIDECKDYKVSTPFNNIILRYEARNRSLVVYPTGKDSLPPSYEQIYKELNSKNFSSQYEMIDVIEKIIEYIDQKLPSGVNKLLFSNKEEIDLQKLFDKIKVKKFTKSLGQNTKNAAAYLCGILLISESFSTRNPTGGKFERKSMQNVLKLAKENIKNPFEVVFNKDKPRFLPAGSGYLQQSKVILSGNKIPKNTLMYTIENYVIKLLQTNFDSIKHLIGDDKKITKHDYCVDKLNDVLDNPLIEKTSLNQRKKDLKELIEEYNNLDYSRSDVVQIESIKSKILKDIISKDRKRLNKVMNNSL